MVGVERSGAARYYNTIGGVAHLSGSKLTGSGVIHAELWLLRPCILAAWMLCNVEISKLGVTPTWLPLASHLEWAEHDANLTTQRARN